MLKRSQLYRGRRICRIVDDRMAYSAVVPDYFSIIADVFTVMTAKTSREIKMADVIRMR